MRLHWGCGVAALAPGTSAMAQDRTPPVKIASNQPDWTIPAVDAGGLRLASSPLPTRVAVRLNPFADDGTTTPDKARPARATENE